MDGLIRDFIREEIAYREGVAMQLDVDDIIVRRRLRQKLEIFAKDVFSQSPPNDEQLQEYLDENSSDYLIQPLYTFRHVLFRVDDDASQVAENARSVLRSLRDGDADAESAGDLSLMPASFSRVRSAEVDATFGAGFAQRLEDLQTGEWHGPVRSGIGLHLVLIDERIDARMPALDEIRDEVNRDLQAANYSKALALLYERLAEKYTITVDPVVDGDGSAGERLQ
ncbi:MAG: peptidyl-prolyl cis-trans isomerase [Gammaproteobacteria bacterium]|nr:peptidyl-prolyl cis-trans isomerase [Gammaproteobacteria bacterium]